MIKAIVMDKNNGIHGHAIKTYRHHTVKDILKIMVKKYGKVGRNTLTTDHHGVEVIRWNFKFAHVILYGDGVKTQFGYRTIK